MKIVYIAHRLRGATAEETQANRRAASELVARFAIEFDIAPVASWIILSEHWTEEQGGELGLKIDCALIDRCDELWICGTGLMSEGMKIEVDHAMREGLRIVDRRNFEFTRAEVDRASLPWPDWDHPGAGG